MKFATDIHVPLRVNHNNFGDPLTFHLAPSSQDFNLFIFNFNLYQYLGL